MGSRAHELPGEINHRIHSAGRLSVNREILRQHRRGRIQYEHDIHAAVFRAADPLNDLRACERDGRQH